MTPNVREGLQYGAAIVMLLSGVVLTFLSFFLNNYVVSDGVLWYVSQTLVYSGAIFGVNVYFKTKLGNFESIVKNELANMQKQQMKEGKEYEGNKRTDFVDYAECEG